MTEVRVQAGQGGHPLGSGEGRACQTTTVGSVILGKQGENGNGVGEEGAVCLIRAQDQ